ncbi:MAG: hypothetical protein J6Z14_01195 [Prevotella sp.]|nr:hypothetical protein [Prevotella sp.]
MKYASILLLLVSLNFLSLISKAQLLIEGRHVAVDTLTSTMLATIPMKVCKKNNGLSGWPS